MFDNEDVNTPTPPRLIIVYIKGSLSVSATLCWLLYLDFVGLNSLPVDFLFAACNIPLRDPRAWCEIAVWVIQKLDSPLHIDQPHHVMTGLNLSA